MQIQVQHVFGGKSGGGKPGDEEFVDHAIALLSDGWGSGCGGMAGDNQPHERPSCGQRDGRAIVKSTGDSTFRMSADLDGRTRQNGLDFCQIKQAIVATAPDNAESGVQNLCQYS